MNHIVLLVEDDASDTQLIRRAFEKANVSARIVRTKDGDDAVAYLDGTGIYSDREQHPLPTLVLLDIKLPRRSGFEVLSWIRRDPRPLRRIPVVILTSSKHAVDITRAYELGANAYTVKPDTSAELVDLVSAVRTFWIDHNEFPLLAAAVMPPSAGRAGSGATSHTSPVLLVEDERSDAALIIRAFTRAGFSGPIEHVTSANAALEWLHRQFQTGDPADLPGLILLDLKLPGMSGLELLDRIRSLSRLRQVPVVVLASAHDAETINRAYERGANSYLVKTPDPDEVSRLIVFMQQYWLNVNQSSLSHRR